MVGVLIGAPRFEKLRASVIFAKRSMEILSICCTINYIGIIEIFSTV